MLDPSGTKKLLEQLSPLLPSAYRQFDFVLAAIGSVLIGVRMYFDPSVAESLTGLVGGLLGVVLGAVLAGAAIQAAFLDSALLRNIAEIGEDPVKYLRHSVATTPGHAHHACPVALGP